MPYRCVRCGKIYDDTAQEILKGCSCGCHYFFFFRAKEIEKKIEPLTREEREEIIKDIEEMIPQVERPVVLDLETIRVSKPGKFEIDLINLFKGNPVIFKVEEGKYIIDIASTFQLLKKKKVS
ncbi:MAG TPA: hypothetical protein ENF67_00510 [Candidatus Pacearchaeota archaeon]|nr:hypothetical protein [Candidatus Pacearchaeota archaeon]